MTQAVLKKRNTHRLCDNDSVELIFQINEGKSKAISDASITTILHSIVLNTEIEVNSGNFPNNIGDDRCRKCRC